MLGVREKRSRLFLVAVPAMITPRRLRKKTHAKTCPQRFAQL
jgi:hypothetical protein